MKYLLLPFYGTYLKKKYRLEFIGKEKIMDLDGPAVVFANHVHTLDPFFISAVYPYHIRWVAGSYLFRMGLVGYLLKNWVQAIPKTQGRSDLATIRNISEALKKGDVVGLFPEGTRTWDGDMMDIQKATAKLVRIFKCPIVFLNIEGGFENKPRWAEDERKGKIVLRVVDVLLPEDISSLGSDEIQDRTTRALSYSHEDWKRRNPGITYKSPHQAEGIERLFYICPRCKSIGTIKAEGDRIYCTRCGASTRLDGRYDLVEDKGFAISSMTGWHEEERKELRRLLKTEDNDKTIFSDRCILFQKREGNRLVKLSSWCKVESDKENLFIILEEGNPLRFPYKEIESMIICAKYTVEFFHSGQQYRFRLEGRQSSLKYQDLYLEIHSMEEK